MTKLNALGAHRGALGLLLLGVLLLSGLTDRLVAQPTDLLDAEGKLPADTVVVYPILGAISARSFTRLEEEVDRLIDTLGVKIIVFEISSPGGELQAGLDLASYIFELHRQRGVDVYAYIANKTNAHSAAALAAFATPTIVVGEDSQIGDVIPITGFGQELPEKIQTLVRSKMSFYAKENGYPVAIAQGMVSPNLVIYELTSGTIDGRRFVTGAELDNYIKTHPDARSELQPRIVAQEGQAITLSGKEAWEYKIAAKISPSIDHLVTDYGLNGPLLRVPEDFDRMGRPLTESTWARWLDLTFVKFFLIVLGIIGIALELKMPGTLLPAGVGLVAFLLFFAGGYANGNVQWLEVVLFLGGCALIAVEMFVIPGFGVAGISGLALLFSSLVLSLGPTGDLTVEGFVSDSVLVVTSLGAGLIGILVLLWLLPRFGFLQGSGLVQSTNLSSTPTLPSTGMGPGSFAHLEKKTGELLTDCRPSGKARIDGVAYDVVSDTGFIDQSSPIRVVRVEGNRIVVRSAPTATESGGDDAPSQ